MTNRHSVPKKVWLVLHIHQHRGFTSESLYRICTSKEVASRWARHCERHNGYGSARVGYDFVIGDEPNMESRTGE